MKKREVQRAGITCPEAHNQQVAKGRLEPRPDSLGSPGLKQDIITSDALGANGTSNLSSRFFLSLPAPNIGAVLRIAWF